MPQLDWELIARQMIRAMRGEKSQAWVNQRLQAGSNLIHRWENGHAKPTWEDFLKFSNIFKIDIKKLFISYFRYEGPIQDLGAFFNFLFSNKKISEISRSTGMSPAKLRRLISNETQGTLLDVLQVLFGLDRLESLALVYEMTQGAAIPYLDELNQKRINLSEAYHSNPNFGLVFNCLSLPDYKKLDVHQDSFIAKMSGLSLPEVQDIIKFCLANELIEEEGKIYKMNEVRVSDRAHPKHMKNTRRFWIQKALDKIETSSSRDAFGSVVFCASQKSREEIIALYLRFFNDFKNIVENDKEAEQLPLVMNFQLFHPGKEES